MSIWQHLAVYSQTSKHGGQDTIGRVFGLGPGTIA
jgi:hypothetical protein